MNLIDRAISFISPKAALSRVEARARLAMMQAGGYTGASAIRRAFKGWSVSSGDADRDLLSDLPTLRARSRDLSRNNPLATGALNTAVTNVVGSGLKLQSRIDREFLGLSDDQADRWERQAERQFNMWAESADCDATRTENFYGLQALSFLSTLMNGDAFLLFPRIQTKGVPHTLRLQLIEADRVKNPDAQMDTAKVAAGVEIDQYGAPVKYHIANQHPGSWEINSGYKAVPAFGARTGRRNVLHLYDRLRVGQRRGAPYLAPVIEPLKQLGRYFDAELMAAVVSGFFTGFIKSERGLPPGPGDPNAKPGELPEIRMGNAAIMELKPGEDIEFANPGRPNPAFDAFVLAVLRSIGAALEIPFEILIKHFTASYSASRAALLEAWRFFSRRRAWLVYRLCQPVYVEWLHEEVACGHLTAPGFFTNADIRQAYAKSEWIGPAMGQIDPLKEVKAASMRVDEGFSTLAEDTQALTGGDWETKHRQRVKEQRMRREGGLVPDVKTNGEKYDADSDDNDSDD